MSESAQRTLELDIGAVLVPEVRVAGTIASPTEISPSADYLRRFPPAGVVVFGRTPAGAVSPVRLLRALRATQVEHGEHQPFACCDLEQGAGLHFPEGTRLPPALVLASAALGARTPAQGVALLRAAGELTARDRSGVRRTLVSARSRGRSQGIARGRERWNSRSRAPCSGRGLAARLARRPALACDSRSPLACFGGGALADGGARELRDRSGSCRPGGIASALALAPRQALRGRPLGARIASSGSSASDRLVARGLGSGRHASGRRLARGVRSPRFSWWLRALRKRVGSLAGTGSRPAPPEVAGWADLVRLTPDGAQGPLGGPIARDPARARADSAHVCCGARLARGTPRGWR